MDTPQHLLHSLYHNIVPQEKLQSFFNLRKTHYSMRFGRGRQSRNSPDHKQETTSFPVVVNNRIRSFKSERCVKFTEEIDNPQSLEKKERQYSPIKKKLVRDSFSLFRKDRTLELGNLSSMYQTIKIKRLGLLMKETDRMRRTEMSFKSNHDLVRKGSLMGYDEYSKGNKAKLLKKQVICGWQTSLPDYYI